MYTETAEGDGFLTTGQNIIDLFKDAQVSVTSDIPTSPGKSLEINFYLMGIDEYKTRQNGDNLFKIEFGEDIQVARCSVGKNFFWGCEIRKSIYTARGKTNCIEIIELEETSGGIRIASIHSNVLTSHQYECENTTTAESSLGECKLLDLAKIEYLENNLELSLAHFEEAKSCGGIELDSFSLAFEKVDRDSIYLSSFKKGNQLFEKGKYEEALTYFESIKKNYREISRSFSAELEKKMAECQNLKAYFYEIKQGDFYYESGIYDKALARYSVALSYQYSREIEGKANFCERKIQEGYRKEAEKEIEKARGLILRRGELDEGFSILYKYSHSGLLSGKDYFLMAQIANTPSRRLRKAYNISHRNRCLLTRQYLLKAYGLGFRSDGFDIFWNEYLNEKDRSCD